MSPPEFRTEDWTIVVEALAYWAGSPEEASGRRERAYELIEAIADHEGVPPSDLVR